MAGRAVTADAVVNDGSLREFRQKLHVHHPDKGGDLQTFLELHRCYLACRQHRERLNDPKVAKSNKESEVDAGDKLSSASAKKIEEAASTTANCSQDLLEGDRLFTEGRLQCALRAYTRALRSTTDRSPASAGLHLKCADVLFALNQPAAAIKFTRKAADLRPQWAEAHRRLGLLLKQQGYPLEAAEALQRALTIDPSLKLSATEAITDEDTQPPALLDNFQVSSGSVRAVRFCPAQPKLLATAALDSTVSLWSVDYSCDGLPKLICILGDPKCGVTELEWSSSGQKLASCTLHERSCCVWTIEKTDIDSLDEQELRIASSVTLIGHEGRVTSVQFSSDERFVFTGSTDKTARLWNLETGLCECVVRGHGGMIPSIALAGDQAEGSRSNGNDKEHQPALLAATASGDGVARMWNLSAGGQCWQEMKGWSEGAVNLCAFAPTGLQCSNLLFTAHIDFDRKEGRILAWETKPGGEQWVDDKLLGPCQQYNGFRAKVETISFASDPSGSLLMACCTSEGYIKVFDVGRNTCLYDMHIKPCERAGERSAPGGGKLMAKFSPCGTYLAALGGGDELKVFSAEEGKQLLACRHQAVVQCLDWAPGGKVLAVGTGQGAISLHSLP